MCFTSLNFVQPSPLFRPTLHRNNRKSGRPVCSLSSPRTGTDMKLIRGLSEIAEAYDGVLLDQFGVIHDGQTPYPRALHAIRKLSENGVKIVILSNSSRQSTVAEAKLQKMGVDPANIHGIVTSGQLTLEAMKRFMARAPDSRVLHFTWTEQRGGVSLRHHNISRVAPLTDSVNGASVPCPDEVDFILAHGTDALTSSLDTVEKVPLEGLRELCRELGRRKPNLPFYCANPDMVTVDGPQLRVMPGTLAKDFEDAGGKNVYRLGKPSAVAYDAAVELLGISDRGRILAIGDSVGHDILGGVNAGVDTLYIAGGINAEQFRIEPQDGFREEDCSWHWQVATLNGIVAEEAPSLSKRRPTFVCPFFRW